MKYKTLKEWVHDYNIEDLFPEGTARTTYFTLTGKTSQQSLNELVLLYGDLIVNLTPEIDVESNINSFYKLSTLVLYFQLPVLKQLVQLNSVEYNPIENYAMTEKSTDNTTRQGTVNQVDDYTSSSTSNLSGTTYDSTALKLQSSDDGTNTTNGSRTANTTDNSNFEHTLTRKGNIGVTTSQQMYKAEYDLIELKQVDLKFYDEWRRVVCCSIYK